MDRGERKRYPDTDTQRYCLSCKQYIDQDLFAKKKNGLQSSCKKCQSKYNRIRLYNIDIEQYNKLICDQKNKCAICGKWLSTKPYVDHDHSTGIVRGLLCNRCNLAIGAFKDDIDVMESAVKYLKSRKT
jgi:hypothetical protein